MKLRAFAWALGLVLAPVAAVAAPAPNATAAAEQAEPEPLNPEAAVVVEQSAEMDEDALAIIPTDELSANIVPLTRDELATLVGEALESARLRTVEVVEHRKTNPRTAATAAPGAPEEQQAARDAYDREMQRLIDLRGDAFERLNLILDEWEEKGGDAEKIEEYRAYRRAVVSDTVSGLTLGGTWSAIVHWAGSPDGGIRLLKGVAIFILSIVALIYFAKLLSAGVSRTLSHSHKTSHLLQTFIGLLVFWIVVMIGLTLIVASFGFDITPVFALLGGASFILAFAMQETLGNFTAGMMILVYRPFDQGDRIVTAGVEGRVRKVNLTSTILVTPDNQLVTVPNSKVWNEVIFNTVDLGKRRIDLEFRINHPHQALAAADGLVELLPTIEGVEKQPAPEVYFGGFDGRGAKLQVRPWTRSKAYWATRRAVTRAVMEYLTAQRIELWAPNLDADFDLEGEGPTS